MIFEEYGFSSIEESAAELPLASALASVLDRKLWNIWSSSISIVLSLITYYNQIISLETL